MLLLEKKRKCVIGGCLVDDQIMGPDCLKLEAVKQPFRCNILLGLYLFHCSLSLHFPPNPI